MNSTDKLNEYLSKDRKGVSQRILQKAITVLPQGLPNEMIAVSLGISTRQVRLEMRKMIRVCGAGNKRELIKTFIDYNKEATDVPEGAELAD